MHLRGHAFQVVGLNDRAVSGVLRDTVHVPPMSMSDVALDAGEAARWIMLEADQLTMVAAPCLTAAVFSGRRAPPGVCGLGPSSQKG
ncbi:MAG: multicopper oxidase domain-containing protein [Hydrogenophaga sp.]|nr:multicopper oxidase domain-containing protein [Hydrogenophaga sp.]